MKKAIAALFALLLLISVVSGSLATEEKNKPEIKTIDNYVAVFDFEVRTGDKYISRSLADKVIHEFSQSDKYEVIDRGNMNKILGEQKFQMSGCVAQECKVEAGQILGVGKVVNGSVGLVGKTYYLTLQLIDVKTGKVELSAEDECRCEIDELLGSTRRLAKKLLDEKVEQPAPVPAAVSKPAGPAKNPVVLMETSLGNMKLELFAKEAPISVRNFLDYVNSGFYDGTIFHRAIPNFMIQGGGFMSDLKQKKTNPPIKNEADNGLKNLLGTLSMARTMVVDSATSQFFINVVDNGFLNHRDNTPQGYGYAVFGKVSEGMDVVNKIVAIRTGTLKGFQDVPETSVVIKSMKVLP